MSDSDRLPRWIDGRSVLPGYWDGICGGVCIGLSAAVVLYLIGHLIAAHMAGRL